MEVGWHCRKASVGNSDRSFGSDTIFTLPLLLLYWTRFLLSMLPRRKLPLEVPWSLMPAAFRTFTTMPFPHWATVSHPDKSCATKRCGIMSLCFVAVAFNVTAFLF